MTERTLEQRLKMYADNMVMLATVIREAAPVPILRDLLTRQLRSGARLADALDQTDLEVIPIDGRIGPVMQEFIAALSPPVPDTPSGLTPDE